MSSGMSNGLTREQIEACRNGPLMNDQQWNALCDLALRSLEPVGQEGVEADARKLAIETLEDFKQFACDVLDLLTEMQNSGVHGMPSTRKQLMGWAQRRLDNMDALTALRAAHPAPAQPDAELVALLHTIDAQEPDDTFGSAKVLAADGRCLGYIQAVAKRLLSEPRHD